jgi:hypothetical protein
VLRPTAGAMALPEFFDVFFMRINRYECHNILLICVAFGSDVFVVHPLDPKDESVDLRSGLPYSDILRVEARDVKTRKVFVFVLFHFVIRTENHTHICLILLYDFSAPHFQRDVQRTSAEDFFLRKM